MRSFSSKKPTEWKKDFQRHHIIPVAVLNDPHFKCIFELLEYHGFDPCDFTSNGILLPCTEYAAIKYRLPLHRGPHRFYNELVSECVGIILSQYDIQNIKQNQLFEIATKIEKLQHSLKAMLRQENSNMQLCSMDPARQAAETTQLDYAAMILCAIMENKLKFLSATGFEPVTP
jgi:A nuclease family of the HNH/ENDO VII superfamily with conserved AHH